MAEPKKRLARGLDSLLSATRLQELDHVAGQSPAETPAPQTRPSAGERLTELPIEQITRNPHQPRQQWNSDRLRELADSIKTHGVVQPIVVRQLDQGYQLIAGERRLRAATLAGKTNITALVRRANEDQVLEWALVENIHRADLNPLERARAYRHYISNCSLTQDAAAQRLGEDRSTLANYMRLLDLPEEIRDMLAGGRLSMGHARALLACSRADQQLALARTAADGGLSVRQLEKRLQKKSEPQQLPPEHAGRQAHVAELEREMTQHFGTKVSINSSGRRRQRGRIVIEFYSLDDFDRLREALLGSRSVPH